MLVVNKSCWCDECDGLLDGLSIAVPMDVPPVPCLLFHPSCAPRFLAQYTTTDDTPWEGLPEVAGGQETGLWLD